MPGVRRTEDAAVQRGRQCAARWLSGHGFTLVELLVVMSIIAVLVSIVFPVLARTKERAYLTQCTLNARQIGMAVKMYAQDYDDRFPYATTIDSGSKLGGVATLPKVLAPYVANRDIWFCQSWLAEHGDLLEGPKSMWRSYDATYGYNAFPDRPEETLLGRAVGDIKNSATKPMVWCASGSAHSSIGADDWGAGAIGAVNVCFVDGHVKLIHCTLREFTNQVFSVPK